MESSQNQSATATGGAATMITDPSPATTITTAAASEEAKQNLTQVINSIQKTLAILHQLHLTVSSFNVSSQLPLLQRMNNLVLELDNMTKLADKCNIQVPMEVLNLIDDGKNPDEFTKDVLNSCIAKNQMTKGKTDAFKSSMRAVVDEGGCLAFFRPAKALRKHLLEDLEEAFPEEVEAYREIRASSAAETKRATQAQSVLPNGDVKVKTEMRSASDG